MAKYHLHQRSEADLARKRGRKRPHDRMLIICEGKTEVSYLEAIRQEKRVPSADIKIVPSDYGTEPLKIVEYAIKKLKENKTFDCVYVVFDRDEHHTYHDALSKASAYNKKLDKKVSFVAVPTVPNFELWLLIHFRDVLGPIGRKDVYKELKKPNHYPTYCKASKTIFHDTKDRLEFAVKRARTLRKKFSKHNGTDPYTDVDTLTSKMMKIRRP